MSDYSNEPCGWATMEDGTRRQLSGDECRALLTAIEEKKDRIAQLMTNETAALQMMCDAYNRLKDFGWRDGMYAPKDGKQFEIIENGSTGIFDCCYSGEWPDGHWLTFCDGDCYPSSSAPALFRLYPADEKERKRHMSSARAKFMMIEKLGEWATKVSPSLPSSSMEGGR